MRKPRRRPAMSPAERKARRQLDGRGLALLDYWQRARPKNCRRLKAEGRLMRFILGQQEGYHTLEENLKTCNLPPGGAEEILTEAFYVESEEDEAIRQAEERAAENA